MADVRRVSFGALHFPHDGIDAERAIFDGLKKLLGKEQKAVLLFIKQKPLAILSVYCKIISTPIVYSLIIVIKKSKNVIY